MPMALARCAHAVMAIVTNVDSDDRGTDPIGGVEMVE